MQQTLILLLWQLVQLMSPGHCRLAQQADEQAWALPPHSTFVFTQHKELTSTTHAHLVEEDVVHVVSQIAQAAVVVMGLSQALCRLLLQQLLLGRHVHQGIVDELEQLLLGFESTIVLLQAHAGV